MLRTNSRLVAVVAALLAIGAVAVARAEVTVYDNDFSGRAEYRDLRKSGGKRACRFEHRRRAGVVRVSVRRPRRACGLRPPVVGDRPLPNHDVTFVARILGATKGAARRGAFIEVTVRAGGGGGYTLRVFPHRQRYELLRAPEGGGAGFPARGRSEAINPIGKRNRVRLEARGGNVIAFVNRERLARVTDDNPGDLEGRGIRVGIGAGRAKSDVVGAARRIAVAVP